MSKTGPIRMQIGPLKNHVANHVKRAEGFIKKDIPDDDEARAAYVHELQVTHNNLESISEKLRKKNDEWAALVQELNSEDELQHYTDKCDEIMSLLLTSDDFLTEMKTRLQHHAASSQHQGPTAPAASAALSSGSSPHSHSNAFKAPKIKLPTFSGNYMEFKQFWSIFETNIHNHPHMSKTEKYTYLLSQLEGDAKRAITGIIICDDNYDTAVALLKSRFDRADDRIITMLYSELNLVQPSTSKTSEKQRTLDDCERIFRQLESAGEDINSNKSLVFTLLSKFPAGMVKDLQRYYNVGANSKLNDVREGLNKSIMDEETTAGVISDMQAVNLNGRSSTPTPPKDGRGSGANSRSDNPRQYNGGDVWYQWTPSSSQYNEDNSGGGDGYNTSALPAIAHYQHKSPHQTNYRPNDYARPTNGGAQFLSPPGGCYFCGEHHFNGDCTNYTSAKSRVQRLSEVNRCTRCLKPSRHAKTACPVHIKCIHCRTDEDHASALCYTKYPEMSTVTITMPGQPPVILGSNSGTGSSSSTAGDPAVKDTASGGVTALNHDVKPALFQTAKTTVINPSNGEKCVVRLALDTMSSRSYIRDPVARKLGLNSDKSDKLYVSVFGTTKTVDVPTSLVEFEVTFRDGKRQTIEANTTRVICQASAIPSDWTNDESEVLKQYRSSLADDPYDIHGTIDILIGANAVWDFIEGPRMSTDCTTLSFIPSKFGLMLSGEAQHESARLQPAMLCITHTTQDGRKKTFGNPGSSSVFSSELDQLASDDVACPTIDEYYRPKDRSQWLETPMPFISDKNFQETQEEVKPAFISHTRLPSLDEPPPHLSIDANDVQSATCPKFVKRRVCNKMSARTRDSKPGLKSLFGRISDDDSIKANDYATAKLQCVQNNHFVGVLEAVVSNQHDEQVPSIVHQLGLHLDSGLPRSRGHYEHSDLPTETVHPHRLSKDDRITTQVVEDIHEVTMHSDVPYKPSNKRREFWIRHGPALVRKLVAKRLQCQRFKTVSYKLRPVPPWARLRDRRKISHKAGRSDVDKSTLVHYVVLMSDSDAPRGQRRLRRNTNLLPGHDGRIRAAELKLTNGYSIRRPLDLLVPLEAENVSDEPEARDQPTTADERDDKDQQSTDNEDFFRFNNEDVQRTIDALQRLGGLNSGEAVHSA